MEVLNKTKIKANGHGNLKIVMEEGEIEQDSNYFVFLYCPIIYNIFSN